MDYASTFQISAAGMRLEKLRADVTALNIANMNTARSQAGGVYKPLRVAASSVPAGGFGDQLAQALDALQAPASLPQGEVVAVDVPPRRIHDPGHPQADAQGYVDYPGVDHLGEMLNLMAAVRAYEANLVALNAGKAMAARALEIGSGS
ncbi:MAG: flagellar basal body rod protein FlgC [Aquabacterium sp.]|jgi:flagellar basal-body rod protein FlgC|nr:MAG: flagellar basal body rod protein FlgC [Aquabacterium sp.]TAL13631.1 MAG: flagellar basal body rod protein FlgC [Aquabacterium sp.]